MFKQKNALISLAVVTLVAACGGGGGSDNDDIVDGGGGTVIQPTVDAKLAGTAALAGDLVLFETSGTLVPIAYTAFTSETPRTDGTGFGAFGFAKGDVAPLEAFGYRLTFTPTTPGTAETRTGRLAFELQDHSTLVTAQREALRIEIDKITTSVDAAGGLTVDVADDAKVYVHATDSTGQKATVNAPALDALIRQSAVGDGSGAVDVVLDLDAVVATALAAAVGSSANLAVLNRVKDFAGGADAPMEVALTLSNVNMVLGSDATTALVGKTITVDGSGLPGVTGGGVAKGYVQILEPTPAP